MSQKHTHIAARMHRSIKSQRVQHTIVPTHGSCRGNCVLYKRSLYALARVSGNAFRADADIATSPKNQGCFVPFRLTVFQPLMGTVLLFLAML